MPDMESGQTNGAQDATPATSGSGDQLTSQVARQLETLLKRVDSLDQSFRTIQSGKDKGVRKLEREFASLKSYLDKYGTPEEAERQYKLDQLIGMRSSDDNDDDQVPQKSGRANPTNAATADVDEELLSLLDVKSNDPELVRRIRAGENWLDAAKAIRKSRQEEPTPTGAAVVATGSGGSAQTPQAALQAAYDAEVAKLGRPVAPHVLAAVKQKYRRQGLQIW